MRPTSSSAWVLLAALIAGLAVAACSSDDAKSNAAVGNLGGSSTETSANRMDVGDNAAILGIGDKSQGSGAARGTGIGVNAFLWRGALDTISFMPLASADPFGGVIITDWYVPPGTSGERFKATIYILSRDLRSDGLRVNIYRQVLQGGQWVDAPVADATVGDIENKVLARARQMRERLQASG